VTFRRESPHRVWGESAPNGVLVLAASISNTDISTRLAR